MKTNRTSASTVLLTVAVLCGCDPGLRLKPVELEKLDCCEWIWRSQDVDIRFRSLGGLIGHTWESAEFTVVNKSTSLVQIERGELRTRGRSYEASFSGQGDLRWRSAEPGSTARINLFWDLGETLPEIYGDDAEVELHLAIGDRRETVLLKYQRT